MGRRGGPKLEDPTALILETALGVLTR